MESKTSRRRLRIGCLVSTLGMALLAVRAQAQPFVYVTNSGSGSVSVIDSATNLVSDTISVGSRPVGATFAPDGSRVYVANSASDTISVIDALTNKVIATVAVGAFPQGLAITPDGSRAYVGSSFSNSVSVIDLATNAVIGTIDIGRDSTAVAITPDGRRAYLTSTGTAAVSVIDTATNTLVETIEVAPGPVGIAVTNDGNRVYVASNLGGTTSVVDTATNTVIATVKTAQPNLVIITPDGTRAYVTNNATGNGTVSVLKTATNTLIATVKVGVNAQSLAITPDGRDVYVACFSSQTVSVIDTATNKVTATIGVGNAPVGVAIRPLIYQTLAPAADAYVRAGAFASTNFGAAPVLLAKKGVSPDNTSRSYLTFDVSGVADFARAALRVDGRVASSATPAVTVTVYAVPDTTWHERAITWNTKPDLGPVLGTLTIAGVALRSLEIDITKFLNAERAAGHGEVTLALRSVEHTSADARFNSREATAGEPRLLIGR
jgi:YVTN family beta-propeller protein